MARHRRCTATAGKSFCGRPHWQPTKGREVAGGEFLREAAEAGHPGAMRAMVRRLRSGDGLSRQEEGARRFLKVLADRGDQDAARELAGLRALPVSE
ncbi:MAG: hypothetical protein FJZ01_15925 [Candidatus Sericytochromatia bacterium]|nr:hypothetical protein [Candidatus Tanganyikabacteria bacterium]